MPAVKRQKQDFLQILRDKLKELIPKLDRSEDGNIFQSSPLGLPNYAERIQHPMDTSEMKLKATTVYTSVDELSYDLELMCDNCLLYNGEGSKWAAIAYNLLSVGRILIHNLKTEIIELEKQHKQEAVKLRKSAARRLKDHPMVKRMQQQTAAVAAQQPKVEEKNQPNQDEVVTSHKSPSKEILNEPSEEEIGNKQPPTAVTPVHDASPIAKEMPQNRVGTPLIVPAVVRQALRREIRFPVENKPLVWNCTKILNLFKDKVATRDICLDVEISNYSIFTNAISSELDSNISRYVTAEEQSHSEFPSTTPSDTFGVELLIRLVVSLPSSLIHTSDDVTTSIILVSEELLQFVSANWDYFQSVD